MLLIIIPHFEIGIGHVIIGVWHDHIIIDLYDMMLLIIIPNWNWTDMITNGNLKLNYQNQGVITTILGILIVVVGVGLDKEFLNTK